MNKRLLFALAVLAFLSGCASSSVRPDAYRRTALILADEIHRGVVEWDKKIEAEQNYQNAVQKRIITAYERNVDDEARLQAALRTDAFIDEIAVEKRGVSLTTTRKFVKDMHDWKRDTEAAREEKLNEARQQAAIAFTKIQSNRSQLEAVEQEIRNTAMENSKSIRDRLLKEWAEKIKADYKAIQAKN